MESSELVNAVMWLAVAVIALLPVIVFSKTYMKVRSKRMLYTTVAFSLFLVKGLTLALKLFIPGDQEVWYLDDEFWWSVAAVLDVIIIGLIVLALGTKE